MRLSGFPHHLLVWGFLLFTFQTTVQIEAATLKCGGESSKSKTNAAAAITTVAMDRANSETADIIATTTTTITTVAPISSTTTEATEVQKLLHTVQCTLEKARPWMEEIEKEAKRLEQTAKRFGEGVIHRLSGIFEKLFTNEEHSSSIGSTHILNVDGGADVASGGSDGSDVSANDNAEVAVVENVLPAASTPAPAPAPDVAEIDKKTPCVNATTAAPLPAPAADPEADDVELNEIASQ